MATLHDFTMKTIDGQQKSLGDYRGQVVLVVNVASKCGLTPQYKALEELYEEYKDEGFSVLGFPCNDFAGQEPGTEEEIKSFCSTQYDVSFPLFAKVKVLGDDKHPLYAFLSSQQTTPEGPGEVAWNFGKFLVGKDGQVLARFSPKTAPDADAVIKAIEKATA
jgi:glutathione peroxidase